jgi:hypothetical protein
VQCASQPVGLTLDGLPVPGGMGKLELKQAGAVGMRRVAAKALNREAGWERMKESTDTNGDAGADVKVKVNACGCGGLERGQSVEKRMYEYVVAACM